MEIKPADLLFVWGTGPIDYLIEEITDGPSHVAIFKTETTLIEAQAGRLIGESDLSFYFPRKTRCEVWSDPTLTDLERQQMMDFAITFYGAPYDYVLIPLEFLHFEIGMRLNWYHEHKHRVCSTLAYDLALRVGRKWTDTPNPAPVDLMRGGMLEKKGDLVQDVDLAVS